MSATLTPLLVAWARHIIYWCTDGVIGCLACFSARRYREHVLIIRPDAIGDYLLWRNAAEELIQHYLDKQYRVTLVANAAWASLAKSDLPPHFSFPISPSEFLRRPGYRIRTAWALARLRPSIAISPIFSRTVLISDSILRISGASSRIGSEGDTSNSINGLFRFVANTWLTCRVPNQIRATEIERNADFMRSIGFSNFLATIPKLNPSIFRERLMVTVPSEPYVVLFPGASWSGRQWPKGRFSELAAWMHSTFGLTILVCGGTNERALAQEVCASSEGTINMAGSTSLEELAKVFKGAKLVISNETSAVHMAAAVGTPSICITGGGHFGRFLPYMLEGGLSENIPFVVTSKMPCFNCNWNCIYFSVPDPTPPAVPCIENISLAQVQLTVSSILERLPAGALNINQSKSAGTLNATP